ncbi:MAG: AlpA family phage regulatory protein [Cytophagaceae bacterium]|nr:MAG: AlpA family phage regulatory protein [Cytophagaceae bacterium]
MNLQAGANGFQTVARHLVDKAADQRVDDQARGRLCEATEQRAKGLLLPPRSELGKTSGFHCKEAQSAGNQCGNQGGGNRCFCTLHHRPTTASRHSSRQGVLTAVEFALLDKPSAATFLALSESTFEQLMRDGSAPIPQALLARRVGWLVWELREWAETKSVSDLLPRASTGRRVTRPVLEVSAAAVQAASRRATGRANLWLRHGYLKLVPRPMPPATPN